MELLYKTRGGKSAQGLQRILFACHPADRDRFLDEIASELLALHDAAVFYTAEEGPIPPEALSRMQLLVIPVTRRLLREACEARDGILPEALAARLPVLPLVQEARLAAEFNQVCGNIQFLDKTAEDETAIPYGEKLRRFLDSILLGDEQIRHVRAAFDAYIFLSYRKKDRAHAQKLMRLIHQNEFCRDIAIWYDEFLVPGEDFNEAITRALQSSKLFALVVTPNLVNEPNYVRDVEYPMAKAENKPVLPLVVSPTDREMLAAHYEGLPETVDGRDAAAVTAALRRAVENLALGETKNDPAHLFFIGLAYLSGIDVEVDRERGIALITRAAEAGLVEAVCKLASVYECGDGVARDIEIALSWRERLVELRLAAYREKRSSVTAHAALVALERLLEKQREQLRWREAEGSCRRMRVCLEELRAQGISYYPRWDALIAYYHAVVLLGANRYDEAEARCREALTAAQGLQGEDGIDSDISALYETLGRCAEARGDLRAMRAHYERALSISSAMANKTKNGAANHVVGYIHLVDLAVADGDLCAAQRYLTEARALADAHLLQDEGLPARRALAALYSREGQLACQEDKIGEAEGFYLQSLSISQELYERYGYEQELDGILADKMTLGGLLTIEQRAEESLRHYEEGLVIAERLYAASKTRTAQLAVLRAARESYSAAWRAEDEARAGACARYMSSLMRRVREQGLGDAERLEVAECHRAMGEHALSLDDGARQARTHFAAAYRLMRKLRKTGHRILYHERVVELGAQLGALLFASGRLLRAYVCLRRAVAEGEALLQGNCTNSGRDSVALAYFHSAFIPTRHTAAYARRAKEIWEALCAACPEVPLYSARLALLDEVTREMGWKL